MKKIFTLAIGSLFALSVMAADHKPSVTVKSNNRYEVVIDGKSYKGDSYIDLSNLFPGYHSIKVYDVSRHSMFRRRAKLISSSDFTVKRNDVVITVDRFGRIDVDEMRSGRGKGWDNKDFGNNDHKNGRNNHF